jgi:hypothetical protein
MSLWGTTTAAEDKPKFLPVDSNAAGSTGAREHCIAVAGGWGLSPGLAASGNDNPNAQPEVLVCVKNIAEFMGSASIIGIDWTDATIADTGLFDITVTFDEAVDITSAAWSANQTITNKAYILLSRVGKTDMVEDSTVACMYYEGSGTNQITFRGTAQTNAAAGFLAFNGEGVGETGIITGINFDGSANLEEEEGKSAIGIRLESGTAAAGTAGDSLIADGSAAATLTVNGALTQSTTLVVDAVAGATLAVGQVITVNGAGSAPAASITDADGNTGLSTDNTLTITAVASQTSVTVSEPITVADNIVLLASTNGGEEVNAESIDFQVAGPEFAAAGSAVDITGIARTGEELGGSILLEQGTEGSDNGEDAIVLNGTDGSSTNADSFLDLEDFTSGLALYTQAGSSSGSALVLNGITVAAA